MYLFVNCLKHFLSRVSCARPVYKGLRDDDSCVVYSKACFGSVESPALLACSLARLVDVHVQLRGWSSLVVGGDWFFVVRFHRCWREILIALIEKTTKNKVYFENGNNRNNFLST